MSEIKECPHHRGPDKRNGHFVYGVCEECVVERWMACNELVDIRDRQLSLQKEVIETLIKTLELIKTQCHGDAVVHARIAIDYAKEKLR